MFGCLGEAAVGVRGCLFYGFVKGRRLLVQALFLWKGHHPVLRVADGWVDSWDEWGYLPDAACVAGLTISEDVAFKGALCFLFSFFSFCFLFVFCCCRPHVPRVSEVRRCQSSPFEAQPVL